MTTYEFSMRQLLAAGVHFGHQTHRWNPLMEPYIHSTRSGIHIIDLTQTVPMMHRALKAIETVTADGGALLLVGTKRQASRPVAEAAARCNQFHVNHRWLGGTLTNWHTVSNSIKRLNEIDERIESGVEGLTKKERLGLLRSQAKLQSSLGGIRDMESVPDILFVIDVNMEALAVAEANKLGIPVVAVVDTNCSTEGVAHMIPGNDDSIRAINLYLDLVTSAALRGTQTMLRKAGMDIDDSFEDIEIGAMEQAGKTGSSPTGTSGEEATQNVDQSTVDPVSEAESGAVAEAGMAAVPPAGAADAAAPASSHIGPIDDAASKENGQPSDVTATEPDDEVQSSQPDPVEPQTAEGMDEGVDEAVHQKPDPLEEERPAG